MMYLPLAIFSGLFRMIFWNLFCILSYFRPDINVYPRGLESYDMGHLTFVATVRLFVEREVEYIEMYPSSKSNIRFSNLGNDMSYVSMGDSIVGDSVSSGIAAQNML